MSIERLKIGEPLPLRLNAFDGKATLFPQVILRNAADTLVGTFDLTHVADGLYKNAAQTFPATPLLTAIYKVYSDAGHTVLDTNYQDMLDVFLQADAVLTPNSIQIVERVEVKLKQNRITYALATARVLTALKSTRLKVIVIQPKIEGRLKQNRITGVLRECS